jgi:hypothetical protein
METAGFMLYAAALALGPLALVQSVAAGGVGILTYATARFERRRLTRRDLAGSLVAVIGLACLAVLLAGGDARDAQGSTLEIGLWLAATAAAAVVVMTVCRGPLGRGVACGIAGGLFFAAGDIRTKLATDGGVRTLFVIPLVLGYLLGTSLLQLGYQSAVALTVAGLATLLTNAIPIAAGTVVLGEPLPGGTLGIARALAFAAVTVGAILLARPANRPAAAPAHEPAEQVPALTRGPRVGPAGSVTTRAPSITCSQSNPASPPCPPSRSPLTTAASSRPNHKPAGRRTPGHQRAGVAGKLPRQVSLTRLPASRHRR